MKVKTQFEDVTPGDEVLEDVGQLARELWFVNESMKDSQGVIDEHKQLMKTLKEKRETCITKIAKCGKYVVVDARKIA
jgi:hypothetical protein